MFLLSLVLALAYMLVIVYASLQPFRNWRLPAADVYGFLTAPWPRYITLNDVLFNLSAYLPLGFMLTLGLRLALRPLAAVAAGVAIAALLSIAMESVQMFLPARVANNVDVLANSLGALIGALAAPLFLPAHALGARVGTLRDSLFVPGALTDIGALLALLWIVTFLNPWSQLFGAGDLRDSFELPALLGHTANRLLAAESLVVFFNVTGIGLLLSTLLRVEIRRGVFVGAFVVSALAVKMLSAGLLGKPLGTWASITPGMLAGLMLSALVLRGLFTFGHRARLRVAWLCFVLALLAINFAPDNPYFSLPPRLARSGISHFLSFWSIMRALSELWPLLAIGYLSVACWRQRERYQREKAL